MNRPAQGIGRYLDVGPADDHHIGFSEEDQERYLSLLTGEKGSVLAEYREIAKKEVDRV